MRYKIPKSLETNSVQDLFINQFVRNSAFLAFSTSVGHLTPNILVLGFDLSHELSSFLIFFVLVVLSELDFVQRSTTLSVSGCKSTSSWFRLLDVAPSSIRCAVLSLLIWHGYMHSLKSPIETSINTLDPAVKSRKSDAVEIVSLAKFANPANEIRCKHIYGVLRVWSKQPLLLRKLKIYRLLCDFGRRYDSSSRSKSLFRLLPSLVINQEDSSFVNAMLIVYISFFT